MMQKSLLTPITMCAFWTFENCTLVELYHRLRKEERRVSHHNNRARKREQIATLTLTEWLERLKMAGFCCGYCGNKFEAMDHIVAIGLGGGTSFQNCVPCCRTCGNKKGQSIWL